MSVPFACWPTRGSPCYALGRVNVVLVPRPCRIGARARARARLGLLLGLLAGVACNEPRPADTGANDATPKDGAAKGPEAQPDGPQLPAAEEVLARAAEAMGGKAAIDRVHSFYYRGTIELSGQAIRGDLEIWWEGGDFFMEQVVPGLGRMRAGKRGDEIWSDDPIHGLRRLSGVEAEQHAWASSLLLAAEWKRYFQTAKTIGTRTEGDRTLYDVELGAPSGLRVIMSFDAATGLQAGQSFEQVTPMGKQPLAVRFEDYRKVEGLELAYRQVIDAKVQEVVQVISEVRINAEVDEAKFAFPHTGADLVLQADAPPSPTGAG